MGGGGQRRRVRRHVQFLLVCLAFLLTWTLLTVAILYAQDAMLGPIETRAQNAFREARVDRSGEASHPRGIQVLVGHYNGNLPGEKKHNWTQDELDVNEYSPIPGWGDNGIAVSLNITQEIEATRTFPINQFSLYASDRISVHRSLPDVRRQQCRTKAYPAISSLPTTSIIVVFHNEAWSTLLRTVHSVIARSPRPLIKEIILVDDDSKRAFLQQPLEEALAALPVPAKIVRSSERIGLIRARLIGAEEATGDVLTFLDSHVECTEGWLEPLLSRIKDDRNTVVCPVIDVINDHSFAYQKGIELFRGGFNWNLQFRWYAMPSEMVRARKNDPTAPIETPTMAGGLFAMDRRYFEELGGYDPDMDIWGGENLEMSFRIWQCGGRIEILPCSHVGHIFRRASPHDFPGQSSGSVLNANLMRVAEVWMDEWKWLFYKTAPQALRLRSELDVSERLELRRRLNCRSFRWFLDNVFVDHFMPTNSSVFGRVSSASSSLCLLARPTSEGGHKLHRLSTSQCSIGFDLWQLWVLTAEGRVRSDEHECMVGTRDAFDRMTWTPQLKECGGYDGEIWNFVRDSHSLVHTESGLCLTAPSGAARAKEGEIGGSRDNVTPPLLRQCSGAAEQQWRVVKVQWQPELEAAALA